MDVTWRANRSSISRPPRGIATSRSVPMVSTSTPARTITGRRWATVARRAGVLANPGAIPEFTYSAEVRVDMKRRAFLAATLGTGGGRRLGASASGTRSRPMPPNATGRDRTRCDIPIPTSSPSTIASAVYIVDNTPIRRLHTGTLWAEGPAWNGVGRYLVWSDAPNNVQMRYIEDDARVTVFRNPSGNSNGNTFDYEGRQLSCEHGNRRVVRYEQNGTVTEIAGEVRGQAIEFAERHRRSSRRQHLVHGSDLRHSRQLRRQQGRVQRSSPASIASTSKSGELALDHRRDARTEWPLLLARPQDPLRRRHRHGPRNPRV